MRIAVNARFLLPDKLEGIGIVTDEVMKRMVRSHPEDEFDYYFDRRAHPAFVHGSNVHPHVFAPVTRLPALMRWWMNHPVKKHVTQRRADVFFSTDGFIPLGMSTPKVSVVHDVAFLRYPEHLQPRIRRFYTKWMPRYLAYTDHIITVSGFSKQELIDGYHLDPDKISVVYNGITEGYRPLDAPQQEKVREQYTAGRPYFLYLGAIHPRKNILTLIHAFEQYKSSAPHDDQLILAGREAWNTREVTDTIAKSPYKESIHRPGYIATEHATALVASATALIYPSLYEGFGLPLVEAMACGVPVICSDVSSLPEVAGGAALLFDPLDVQQLSQHMSRITKDERLRNELIQSGFERCRLFSWDETARTIYAILQKTAEKRQRPL